MSAAMPSNQGASSIKTKLEYDPENKAYILRAHELDVKGIGFSADEAYDNFLVNLRKYFEKQPSQIAKAC